MNYLVLYSYRLHVVHLWHPWPGLGREAHLWQNSLYELCWLQAEVWCGTVWEEVRCCKGDLQKTIPRNLSSFISQILKIDWKFQFSVFVLVLERLYLKGIFSVVRGSLLIRCYICYIVCWYKGYCMSYVFTCATSDIYFLMDHRTYEFGLMLQTSLRSCIADFRSAMYRSCTVFCKKKSFMYNGGRINHQK